MTKATRLSDRLLSQTFPRRLFSGEEIGEGSWIFREEVADTAGYIPGEDLLVPGVGLLLSPVAI